MESITYQPFHRSNILSVIKKKANSPMNTAYLACFFVIFKPHQNCSHIVACWVIHSRVVDQLRRVRAHVHHLPNCLRRLLELQVTGIEQTVRRDQYPTLRADLDLIRVWDTGEHLVQVRISQRTSHLQAHAIIGLEQITTFNDTAASDGSLCLNVICAHVVIRCYVDLTILVLDQNWRVTHDRAV